MIASSVIVEIISVIENKLNVTTIPIKSTFVDAKPINLLVCDAIVRLVTDDKSYWNIHTNSIIDSDYSKLQDVMYEQQVIAHC